ncbi:histidine phosphatase family protein [Parahaliea sp. F7430]|uniref:Histidine phosphatase family protein n=1 Tax=Sediminihaliea albiluteola TaxID=2758564 RepID=A0A7W2TYE5_9GAMM|nr:histidine phosphatase family protein [Sediminihaliea albiluteola]MBA6414225.1 histidine phosphatase family protein [Sediminihaliea albiluteola]
MNIYLVRHGEAAALWGQAADPGLSELGRQQAAEAARSLLPELPADIQLISSPMLRAQQTAEPLAQSLGLSLTIEPAFREIPSTVPLAKRKEWLKQVMRESWSEQSPLVHQWRSELLRALQELSSPAVVFTHFLVINAIVASLQNSDKVLHFWPDNASVTQLKLVKGELSIYQLGPELDTPVN